MAILGTAIKLVGSTLDGVLGTLTKNQNIVEDQINGPLRAIISEVGGGIWTGAGANAFVEECQGLFQPNAQSIFDAIGGMVGNITSAREAVEQADQQAANLVGDLAETFANIYKPGR